MVSKKIFLSTMRSASGILLSRSSGIVRTMVFGALYGASFATDAFFTATVIALLLRELLAEGVLSNVLIPEYRREKEKSDDAAKDLIAKVLGFFTLVGLGVAFLNIIFADTIISWFKPTELSGDIGEFTALTRSILYVTAFFLPIAIINAVTMAILATQDKTFRAMFSSTFYNVGCIIGALGLSALFRMWGFHPIMGFAVGTLLGGWLQFIFQAFPLFKEKTLPLPDFRVVKCFADPRVKNILWNMLPRVWGHGATFITTALLTQLQVESGEGVLTVIRYALQVILVPVGLFGVAAGFSSLTQLSKHIDGKEAAPFWRLYYRVKLSAMGMSFLACVGFAIFGVFISYILFYRGKMSQEDIYAISVCICSYSIGMFFTTGTKVALQALIALGDRYRSFVSGVILLCIAYFTNLYLLNRFPPGSISTLERVMHFGFVNALASGLVFFYQYTSIIFLAARQRLNLGAIQHLKVFVLLLVLTGLVSFIGYWGSLNTTHFFTFLFRLE